jgi:hypothetical protein
VPVFIHRRERQVRNVCIDSNDVVLIGGLRAQYGGAKEEQ